MDVNQGNPAGQGAVDNLARIELIRGPMDGFVDLVARPYAPWAIRRNAGPEELLLPSEPTENDLKNLFPLELTYTNLVTPVEIPKLQVRGRDTIEQVCGKALVNLHKTGLWDLGYDHSAIFKTVRAGKSLAVRRGMQIWEVMSSDGDGSNLTLKCTFVEHDPENIYAIPPAFGDGH